MKPNRAARRTTKNHASAQSVKPLENATGQKPVSAVKVRIVEEIGGVALTSILSEEMTAALVKETNLFGRPNVAKSAQMLLDDALRAKRRGRFPLQEVEEAFQRASALLALLEAKLFNDDSTSEHSELQPMGALEMGGYIRMFAESRKGLRVAFDHVSAWLRAGDATKQPHEKVIESLNKAAADVRARAERKVA